jgi:uncharacterized surface protein with fasciclin (FAS1) repeats
MQRKLATALIALLMISVLPTNATADSTEDIPTNAAATGVHDSLVAALAHAGLVDTLAGEGPFTVFAPTDQAFADAGIDLSTFDNDEANATLVDILTYHVVSGSVMSSDLVDAATTDALNGDKLSFTVGASEVKVNDAVVTTANVEASNGIIHIIDKVLIPPVDIYVSDGSMEAPYFQFFSDDAGANLVTELDIGSNYKFQRLSNPSAHPFYLGDSGYNTDSSDNLIVVGDGTSTTGISDDESFTLFFRDGFSAYDTLSYFCTVHSNMISTFDLTVSADIPTVAAGTGIHDSLVTALTAANLVTTLQGEGPFTVFAPTDDAFAAAGIDLNSSFNNEEITQLADILTYHVVSGQVLASDLSDGMVAPTVYPGNLTFTVNSDGVMVNDANVISANVPASNGVIHVIDKVLMPPSDLVDIPAVASSTGIHTALVAALAQADLVTTLQGDGPFTVFAPTDDAFTAAGIDLSTFDTDEEIATLADILTYHVVSGAVMSSDLSDGMTATAVNTDSLTFTVSADGVMVNDANVTVADVEASNGVVHVIDKVLMPPADEPTEPEEPEVVCARTIGITSDGYGFTPASTTIAVGETVCWKWTDEDMEHNVKEVTGMKSTTYVENGVYSGVAAKTVDFHHTFTENTTFYYACEPHIGMEMFGKVIVGDGGVVEEPATKDDDKEEKNTPGFLGVTAILAALGAVLVARKRQNDKL